MEHGQLESAQWRRIEARLGGAEALASSARAHRAFLRPRGVRSASDLLRLALMYGPGGRSLRTLSATAAAGGLADVSDVALLQRFKRAADWLEALCRESLAEIAEGLRTSAAERPVRIVDGSLLEGPGRRAWRLHLAYDPVGGRMAEAAITTLKQGERLDRLAVQPGEIRLGDRGFPRPDAVKAVLAAGADLLLRLSWNSLRLSGPDGTPVDWLDVFDRASRAGVVDRPVRMGRPRGAFAPVDLRLVVIRKPPEGAARARAAAAKANRKDQHRRIDPRTLAGADHLILLTSLAPTAFEPDRLAALYRMRWQVELAFKRLKSLLRIDRLPAKDDRLARAWLHAHLLFALMVDQAHAEIDALSP